MSLNLGNITDGNTSMTASIIQMNNDCFDTIESFEELTKSMEAFENCFEILSSVERRSSVECVSFAEELAGTSMENLNEAAQEALKYSGQNIINFFTNLRNATQSLASTLRQLEKKVGEDKKLDKSVTIELSSKFTRKMNQGKIACNKLMSDVKRFLPMLSEDKRDSVLQIIKAITNACNGTYIKLEGKVTVPATFALHALTSGVRELNTAVGMFMHGKTYRASTHVNGWFPFEKGKEKPIGMSVKSKPSASVKDVAKGYDKGKGMIEFMAGDAATTNASRCMFIAAKVAMGLVASLRELANTIAKALD